MAVVANAVKRRLQEGKLAASFNLSRLRTVEAPQIAKACGFHWLFIDLEHSTMDLDTAGQICAASLPVGITPIVRVPEGDTNRAARILDAGAQGIIFPHVQNAKEARTFSSACRFPPLGIRSMTCTLCCASVWPAQMPRQKNCCVRPRKTMISRFR